MGIIFKYKNRIVVNLRLDYTKIEENYCDIILLYFKLKVLFK